VSSCNSTAFAPGDRLAGSRQRIGSPQHPSHPYRSALFIDLPPSAGSKRNSRGGDSRGRRTEPRSTAPSRLATLFGVPARHHRFRPDHHLVRFTRASPTCRADAHIVGAVAAIAASTQLGPRCTDRRVWGITSKTVTFEGGSGRICAPMFVARRMQPPWADFQPRIHAGPPHRPPSISSPEMAPRCVLRVASIPYWYQFVGRPSDVTDRPTTGRAGPQSPDYVMPAFLETGRPGLVLPRRDSPSDGPRQRLPHRAPGYGGGQHSRSAETDGGWWHSIRSRSNYLLGQRSLPLLALRPGENRRGGWSGGCTAKRPVVTISHRWKP